MKRFALLCLAAVTMATTARAADAPAAGLSKLPRQIVSVEAAYPPEAAAAGWEADVVLELTIDATGHVSHAEVATSAGPGREAFDAAAVAAAGGYVFEPAESDGKPVPVQLAYKVKFRLHARPPAPVAAAAPAPPAPVPAPRPPRESLAGALRERGTRTPLIGFVVTASREGASPPEAYEATTDGDGRFAFFDLAPGAWHVDVEAPAYLPFRTTEEVRAGQKTVVTYYVERGQANPLDETVTAARAKKDVTHVVLSADVIDRVPGTAGDPLAVVQNLAGVARAPAGSGLLIVRGSAPEDTQIFVDGMDVPLVYHFGGLRSVLPERVIDSIEFVPGNFSSEYGRANAGIVDVHLKELKPRRFGGSIDVSVLDTGVYLEAPLGNRGGVAVAARRSYLDAILNAVVPSDASVALTTAPVYYDGQLLANYRLSPAHDLRAMVFGADDRLALLFKNPADFSQQATGNRLSARTGFWRALAADRYTPREGVENNLRLSAGQDAETISEGDLVLDLHRRVVQLRDTLRLRLSPWVTLVSGIDARTEKYSGHVRLPEPPNEGQPMGNQDLSQTRETTVRWSWESSPAAFAEVELRPAQRLLIAAGLRADYFQVIHQGVLAPRLSVREELSPRWAIKGALGLYHQPPDVEETDPVFGNPALKAERAVHAALGAEWRPWPGTSLDVTGFYKRLTNLVSPTDATHVENGVDVPLTYDNGGRGRVIGLEVVARRELSKGFVGWIAYTLSRSERLDSGQTDWRLFDYDQTHILAAVAAYDLPRHFRLASRFRYVSGNPQTPVVGSVFNSVTDEYDPVFGKVNSARQPPFVQLDVRLDKQWVFDRWLLDAYLDVQNATNHVNPEGIAYNYDYTQSKVSRGLPILPLLGLRAEF
ncbi:MAG TPA: TonB-dependent receptor [Polyangia bacterium]|nr:TonB-dependent receptor [Polyangia bacterium]